MRTSILSVAVAAALSILSLASAARGQVIYSNFGPGDTWSTNTSFVFGAARLGMRFVPASTGTVTHVDAGMTLSGAPGVTTLSIVTEAAGGTPSNTVVWQGTNNTANGRAVYTFSGASATLTGGQAYWVVSSTTLSLPCDWGKTSPAVAGIGGNTSSGSWETFPFTAIAVFRVAGDNAPCCNTRTGGCTVIDSTVCLTLGLRPGPVESACLPSTCRACPPDYNSDGTITLGDVFDFLSAWFAGCP